MTKFKLLNMIALLECLIIILGNIDLILVGKAFISPILKASFYLMFTTKYAQMHWYA